MWRLWTMLPLFLQAPADLEEGREIFRLRCAECHGRAGEGGRGPNLADGVFYHGGTDADLSRSIQNGIPGSEMPGFSISELRIRQLVAYIRSLQPSTSREELPGDPARGEQLFRGADCLSCHRLGREGGFAGPDLAAVGSRRSLQHLRDSILEPERDVRPRYYVASLVDGKGNQVKGFLLDQDRHSLQLLDFDGALRSFARADLAEVDVSRESTMPSYRGLFDHRELEDLVSFLATRRVEARP